MIVFRVAMFLLTLLVNALLWTTFSKALRHSASSLEAIVITTASNMLTTAVISQVGLPSGHWVGSGITSRPLMPGQGLSH